MSQKSRPVCSLLVLLMQHEGEPFFGASFAPPAMPPVVTFRAALYLRPTSLSSLLVLLMQHGGEIIIYYILYYCQAHAHEP